MKISRFISAAAISLFSMCATTAFAATDPFAVAAPSQSNSQPAFDATIKSRFGLVQTSGYGSSLPPNHLYLNGKESSPAAVGNNHLYLVGIYEAGDRDLIVLKSVGGRGCPFRYSVATADSSGLHPSAFFGSCAEATRVSHTSVPNQLTLTMPVFKSGENLNKTTTFSVLDGKITRDGKPVNSVCANNVCNG